MERTPTFSTYEEWLSNLVHGFVTRPSWNGDIDALLQSVNLEGEDGSWATLFEKYSKKAARPTRKGRGNAVKALGLPVAPAHPSLISKL